MGSPVSPIVANLYMEIVEQKALNSYKGTPPSHWFRYEEDTWVKIKTQDLQPFTKHINSVDKNIKFTREDVKDSHLPFLDCDVHFHEDRNLHIGFTGNPHTPINTYSLTHNTLWNTNWELSEPCNTGLITYLPPLGPKQRNINT